MQRYLAKLRPNKDPGISSLIRYWLPGTFSENYPGISLGQAYTFSYCKTRTNLINSNKVNCNYKIFNGPFKIVNHYFTREGYFSMKALQPLRVVLEVEPEIGLFC